MPTRLCLLENPMVHSVPVLAESGISKMENLQWKYHEHLIQDNLKWSGQMWVNFNLQWLVFFEEKWHLLAQVWPWVDRSMMKMMCLEIDNWDSSTWLIQLMQNWERIMRMMKCQQALEEHNHRGKQSKLVMAPRSRHRRQHGYCTTLVSCSQTRETWSRSYNTQGLVIVDTAGLARALRDLNWSKLKTTKHVHV